jgi:hypothetical protein
VLTVLQDTIAKVLVEALLRHNNVLPDITVQKAPLIMLVTYRLLVLTQQLVNLHP